MPSPETTRGVPAKVAATRAVGLQKQKAAATRAVAPKKQNTSAKHVVTPKNQKPDATCAVAPKKEEAASLSSAGFYDGSIVPSEEELMPPPFVAHQEHRPPFEIARRLRQTRAPIPLAAHYPPPHPRPTIEGKAFCHKEQGSGLTCRDCGDKKEGGRLFVVREGDPQAHPAQQPAAATPTKKRPLLAQQGCPPWSSLRCSFSCCCIFFLDIHSTSYFFCLWYASL